MENKIPSHDEWKDAAFLLHASKKESSEHVQLEYVGNVAALTLGFAKLIEDIAKNTKFSPIYILFGILAVMPSAKRLDPAEIALIADYMERSRTKEDEQE